MRQNYLRDKVLFRPGTERDDQLEFTFAPAADGQQTDLQHWNGLQYRDTGAGTPVLLIHGIGRSLKDWDEQHELLSTGHRVVSVDLPGFGGSEVPPEGMRLEHLAARVAGLVETLGSHRCTWSATRWEGRWPCSSPRTAPTSSAASCWSTRRASAAA